NPRQRRGDPVAPWKRRVAGGGSVAGPRCVFPPADLRRCQHGAGQGGPSAMKRRNGFRTALVVWLATGVVLAVLWAGADAWAQGEEVGNTMRELSWLAARPLPEVVVTLDRASYAPGQKVTVRVEPADGFAATPGDGARPEIGHLTQVVAELVGAEDGSGWTFVWDPPAKPAGYGLVAWVERDGKPVAYGESALDVAVDWTEQPRYGFVSEFGAWDEAKERAAFAK